MGTVNDVLKSAGLRGFEYAREETEEDILNWSGMWWATKDSVLGAIGKESSPLEDLADAIERQHVVHRGFAERGDDVPLDIPTEVRTELEKRGYVMREDEGGNTLLRLY
jgi:hypothetical protein